MNEKQEKTALHPIVLAAQGGQYQVVRKFLNLDESLLKQRDEDGCNLLQGLDDPELFKEIVKMDPTLLTEKNEWSYPIHLIITWAKESFLRWVIEQDKSQLYLKTEREESLLHLIVDSRDPSISLIEWILEEDPSQIRAKDTFEQNLLHISICANSEITRFLIEREPELLFERDQDGSLPIHYLSYRADSTYFLLWLFERFPELVCQKNRQNGFYPIHYAARHGNILLLEYLLEKTPDDLLHPNSVVDKVSRKPKES